MHILQIHCLCQLLSKVDLHFSFFFHLVTPAGGESRVEEGVKSNFSESMLNIVL